MDANEHARPGFAEVRKLLLARAAQAGLQGAEDEMLEKLLDQEVADTEPGEAECKRYYERNTRRFTAGELVEASHILFAITPRVRPERLRAKAAEVHAAALRTPERFALLAREYSNCPSSAQGGSLGQLGRGDTVPEFARAVLEGGLLGVLPDLVTTRFGFHVVLVSRRIPGHVLPYAEARAEVADFLRQSAAERAIGKYLRRLVACP